MTTPVHRRILAQLSDLYAFVRSQEANQAIAAVTVEDLIQEQIKRNGETPTSNSIQFDPYALIVDQPPPQSQLPLTRANFLSGSDLSLPTKMDRLLALENEVTALIREIKAIPPEQIRDPVEEADLAGDTITTAENFDLISDDGTLA